MRKKLICWLLVMLFACLQLGGVTVFAAEAGSTTLNLSCQSAYICDAQNQTVLYEKNADKRVSPASITKVMSVILILEAIESGALHLQDKVTASAHAAAMGGSQIWLEVGEEMTVDELLRAVLVGSANDATVALAEAVSGSEEAFVEKMNQKAQSLGMKNTHFVNAAGLDADGHYTTARDVGKMSAELLSHPKVMEYTTIWMDELRDGKTQLVNTNRLVRNYMGITGLKTGTTGKAGRCLVASAKRDDLHTIAVIMGCDNNDARYGGAEKMLNWAFANYAAVIPKDVTLDLEPLPVLNGQSQKVKVYADIENSVVLPKGKEGELTYRITMAKNVKAPVEDGQTVGEVQVLLGDEVCSGYVVRAAQSVKPMNFAVAFWRYFQALIGVQIDQ